MRKALIVVSSLILTICFMTGISLSGQLTIEKPSQKQLNKIKMVLPDGLKIEESAVVKSSNHKNAYYIGVKFSGKGYTSSVVGLWLIGGSKNNPNLLYSINNKAYIYSQMRKASETKAAAYVHDEESKLLLNHLK